MNTQDVSRLVAQGEGVRLEFKHRVPRPRRIAREVIALANTEGGFVLIGVSDNGELVGVKDRNEEFFALQEALVRLVSPEIALSIEAVRISGNRDVVVVRVPTSHERPHVLVDPDTREETAFIRVGADSVEASEVAMSLMEEEEQNGVHFTFGDRERRLLRYLDRHERITVQEYARMARLSPAKASSTLVVLTRAGLLRLHSAVGEDYFTAEVEGVG